MPDITLDLGDTAELAELLQFLRDWLATDGDNLAESLAGFVGSHNYDLGQQQRPGPLHLPAGRQRRRSSLSGPTPVAGGAEIRDERWGQRS